MSIMYDSNNQPMDQQSQPRTWVTNGLIYDGKTKDVRRGSILIVDDAVEKVVFDDDESHRSQDRSCGSSGKEFSGGDRGHCGLGDLRNDLPSGKPSSLDFTTNGGYSRGFDGNPKFRRRGSKLCHDGDHDYDYPSPSSKTEIDPDNDTIVDAKGEVVTPAFIFEQCRVSSSRSNSVSDTDLTSPCLDVDNATSNCANDSQIVKCPESSVTSSATPTPITSHHSNPSSLQQPKGRDASRQTVHDYIATQLYHMAMTKSIISMEAAANEYMNNLYILSVLVIVSFVVVFFAADSANLFCTTHIVSNIGSMSDVCLFDCAALAMLFVLGGVIVVNTVQEGVSGCLIHSR